jgi:HAE1 family hydrophobic/amphiphilic exporter-1
VILSDTAIKRPVFASMALGAIVVFGIISFRDIGVDLFPRVEFPIITVVSVLPGADPAVVETTVTDPIEEALSSISGIKHLRSNSTESVSQVVVEFELEKNVDVAYQEIQAKIGAVRSLLPKDLEEPVVEKFDIDAAPVMSLVVSGDLPIQALTRLADKVVKDRLQKVKNVGQVKMVGGRKRKIWIWLDREKMRSYGFAVSDVENALRLRHIEMPGGRVETGTKEFIVKTKAELADASQFDELIVSHRGTPVRIRDIGRAEDGLEEERSLARLNDTRAVSLLVRRQSGTNTVEVASAIKKTVQELRQELKSAGLRLEIAQDLSVFIERSVHEVQFHLLFGGALAIVIVFFFLRNLRSTFISSLVIPTSVVGTFIFMNALGFTQNMTTLLALSLAIGLLIDDAIVVQENIMRHVEEGKPARQAASVATQEIALAVFATTLAVVAVFVPVAFMKGLIGRFFFQFGLTVSFAVLISMFVSFTLDPMLSSRLLRKPRPGPLNRLLERGFEWLERLYERLLGWALRWRWLVVLFALGSFVGALSLTRLLRSEFMPLEDQSEFNVRVRAPLGASLQATDEIFGTIRRRLAAEPWLDYTFVTIGSDSLARVNEGVMYVSMTPKEKRTVGQMAAMAWARDRLADLAGAKISVEIVPRISGAGFRAADMQMEVRGTDLAKLDAITQGLMGRMKSAGGYVDLDTTFESGKPQLDIHIDRDRASDLGVNPLEVASAVRALIGGSDIVKLQSEDERIDVAVRFEAPFRDHPRAIGSVPLRSMSGELISLEDLADVRQVVGPLQIDRYSRSRQITIFANLQRDQKVLGQAIAETTAFAKEAELPPGYTFALTGPAQAMQESFGYLFFALVLAIVIVYMVLASQFESFAHPFTIMLSLPLSVIGAVGALVAFGMTLSIFTMIGIILLMGLVTKNGILLVDYTNTLRKRGVERGEAVRKAGPVRLRPILMTTCAMIFGMLPVALGTGSGSESRAPMAIAVIGGLVVSTLLTLVVVPVVYTLVDDLSHPRTWRVVRWLTARKRTADSPSGGNA